MKKVIILFGLVGSLIFTSCKEGTKTEKSTVSAKDTSIFNLAETRTLIEADNARFMADVNKGDSVALAEYYHADGQLILANTVPVMRKDIAGAWGSFIRMGIKDFKISTIDMFGNEELLVETGGYEIFGENNSLIDKGNYVVVWKKENGKWKIYRDIAASSMPVQNVK